MTLNGKILTYKQEVLLKLVLDGKMNKEISDIMGISQKTVVNNLTRLYRDTKLTGRMELAKLYYQSQSQPGMNIVKTLSLYSGVKIEIANIQDSVYVEIKIGSSTFAHLRRMGDGTLLTQIISDLLDRALRSMGGNSNELEAKT